MPKQLSLMVARFPFGMADNPDVTDWLVDTALKIKKDGRIGKIISWRLDDTPITMGRNRAVEIAKGHKVDLLLMLDCDMKPDAYLKSNPNRLSTDPAALPFWETAFDLLWDIYDETPSMIGAPYCGPPPHENVYVFRWATKQSDHPNIDLRIEQYTREEAAERSGIEEVSCLPTGMVLIDMRVFDNPLVKPPYFVYEWTDQFEQKKASTEDCVFTRDLNLANIPLYVTWDCWAGHWKRKCVGKPHILAREHIAKKYIEAALANRSVLEKNHFMPPMRKEPPCPSNTESNQSSAPAEVTPASASPSPELTAPLKVWSPSDSQ